MREQEIFWGFERKIPRSFYDGTTGIEPVDDTIRKVIIQDIATISKD